MSACSLDILLRRLGEQIRGAHAYKNYGINLLCAYLSFESVGITTPYVAVS